MTLDRLLQGLEEAGLTRGRLLMVYTAFRALKPLDATPAELVRGLADYAGSAGVMFPAFTGSPEDSAARPPRLDVLGSPPYTGAVPMAALSLAGQERRSLHPTHSVAAFGDGAVRLLAGHEACSSPCGPGSPIRAVAEENGLVLLLGVGFESLTLIHAAEEEAAVPYILLPEPAVCQIALADGSERFTPPIGLHAWLPPRNFAKLEPECEAAGLARRANLDGRKAWVVQAGPFLRFAVERLRQDPEWGLA